MYPATAATLRFLASTRLGLKRASSLRGALLAALALAVTLAATVAPARSATSASPSAPLHLPAPVGAVTKAYVDAVAPVPPPSSNTPSLETALNPDGSLRGGLSGSFDASGYAITYGADGGPRFVPSGSSSPTAGTYASFDFNAPSSTVRAIAVGGGDVYVGGDFENLGGLAEADRIAKWNGTSWSALGGGTQGTVYAIAVSGSDVYVGGGFTTVYSSGTTPVAGTVRIAKWNGSAWSALGGGAQSTVLALAVSGSDVYAGGWFTSVYSSGTTTVGGTSYVAKWNGSEWSALGGGTNSFVTALAVSGSDVYVGGSFYSVYSSGTTEVADTRGIAKWNGSAWSALGGGVQNTVYAVAVSGSDVYIGGAFTSVYSSGTTPVDGTVNIAKWNGSTWSALGGGTGSTVLAIAVSGGDVYIGGRFASVYSSGTTPVAGTSRVAKWNGSAWSALGGGASGTVEAIAASGSDVYIGADFASVYSSGTTPVAGTSRIAKWNGSTWSALMPLGNGANAAVQAIAVSGSDVYVGGQFTDLGGIAEADRIAKWNGTSWSALGGGAQGIVNALAVSGSDVYVGGQFTTVYASGGAPVNGTVYIAKWNGTSWSALGGGANGSVNAIAVSGGDVYVGGAFTSVYSSGTTPVDGTVRIAKWNGASWSALGGGAQGIVNALAVSGSDVYVGGQFTTVYASGGAPVSGTGFVAKWNGSAWSALGGGAQSSVWALAASGNDVYVGGQFTTVYASGGASVDGTGFVAKWNGSAWSALGGGAGDFVFALAVSGSDAYVGGQFTTVYSTGTTPVAGTSRIAKWNGSAWSALGSGVNGSVLALGLGSAQPGVSALFLGGGFTVAGDGTPTSRFTYFTGPEITPVGSEPEDHVVNGAGPLVIVLGNGSASPRVRIEGTGAVRAEVYDVLGRSVATLVDGEVSGTVEASLPASLAVGSYVVRVVSDGRTTSRTVVVR